MYIAFYSYRYDKDHLEYSIGKNKEFQYALVIKETNSKTAKNKALSYLYEKAENENLIIANLVIEKAEVI